MKKCTLFPLKRCCRFLILINPLLCLMHLYAALWFHAWLFFPTYHHLGIESKSNLPRGFDPELWSNGTHFAANMPWFVLSPRKLIR